MKTACPTEDVLSRYAIGDIDDERADEVQQHLCTCAECEESVSKFDAVSDSSTRHLPLVAAGATSEAERPAWLDVLRDGPPVGDIPRPVPPTANVTGPLAELASYELLGVLGQGGMGVVYRARHRQLNREVALKVLSPRLMATAEARRRFEREIQILGGLHHPGIVMATDANRVGGAAYLVMELIDGVDLARMVRQSGPLSIAETCEAARQMAEALGVAHHAGTVHRDVKPSNVMVNRRGRVKLLDFGLAHLAVLSTESLETSVGNLLGTLDYMAPEQADPEHSLDSRADLYSLGATMFFLLTGRAPHGSHMGRTLMHQLRALAVTEAPRVSSLRAGVPPELDDFIATLLSRDPNDRPQSAEIVAAELSTWADGDLAPRVAELHQKQSAHENCANDAEVANRSLSELLHTGRSEFPTASSESTAKPVAPNTARRWTARIVGLATLAAAIAGIVYGVTILIKTPEGTFKIESEIDNVQVELVDEKDQVKGMPIERGTNESTFRVGRYKVRLAGAHDGITIDKDVITLERGKEVVARITRLPAEPNTAVGEPGKTQPAERLYQGKAESEWQRLFAAETAPEAKLEAAKALVMLAADRPVAERLERILDVGEEVLRASYGDEVMAFAVAGVGAPIRSRRWQTNSVKVGEVYTEFLSTIQLSLPTTGVAPLATALCKAVREGTEARAAIAASLLIQVLDGEGEVSQTVLRELDIPLAESSRSKLCLLIRSNFRNTATPEQTQKILGELNQLGLMLLAAPTGTVNDAMMHQLFSTFVLRFGASNAPELPVSLRKTLASIVLDSKVRPRPQFHFGSSSGYDAPSDVLPPYDPKYVRVVRFLSKNYTDQWLSVVNPYLEKHGTPPYDAVIGQLIQSLDNCLVTYSKSDDWPGDKTAEILTELLRRLYIDEANSSPNAEASVVPASPSMLLTQIVRIKGEIPEFVRKGRSTKSVAARIQQFERTVRGELPAASWAGELDSLTGLLDEDPFRAIALSMGETKLPSKPLLVVRGRLVLPEPAELLYGISATKDDGNHRRAPAIDPLLLLAVLTDLTGANEAQDARIATLLASPPSKVVLRGHLEHLLTGNLRAGEHARRMLQKMAANAKSSDLVEAIRSLNPTLVPSERPVVPTAAASQAPGSERLYQGKTESEWQRLFTGETAPLPKLEAAKSLVMLASELPPEAQLNRILDVGEEIVRASCGDDGIDFALENTTNPTRAARWEFSVSNSALWNGYIAYSELISEQVIKLPAETLAAVLCKGVRDGSDSRAAYAALLLRKSAGMRIIENRDASQMVVHELDIPLTNSSRTALCLLVRARYVKAAPGKESRDIVLELKTLAERLQKAPADKTVNALTCELLRVIDLQPSGELSPNVRSVIAGLILDAIVKRKAPDESAVRDLTIVRRPSYNLESIERDHKATESFLDEWLPAVNAYLPEHLAAPFEQPIRDVVQSIDFALWMHLTTDHYWPVYKTGELLTELLHTYYIDDAKLAVDNVPRDLLPASPSLLLANIVRSKGEIPEFARTGRPKSKAVIEQLQKFEAWLANPLTGTHKDVRLKGLLEDAPYQTIKLCVGENKLSSENGHPEKLLYLTSTLLPNRGSPRLPVPTDPLLMLAVLADLTGTSEAQDQRIAQLLGENVSEGPLGSESATKKQIEAEIARPVPKKRESLRTQLQILLSGSLKSGEHARKFLQQMVAKSKSADLTNAIKAIDPTLAGK